MTYDLKRAQTHQTKSPSLNTPTSVSSNSSNSSNTSMISFAGIRDSVRSGRCAHRWRLRSLIVDNTGGSGNENQALRGERGALVCSFRRIVQQKNEGIFEEILHIRTGTATYLLFSCLSILKCCPLNISNSTCRAENTCSNCQY